MANKVPLKKVTNILTSVGTLNEDFERIEAGFDKTLSRDGSGPNQMEALIDMNQYPIINLPKANKPGMPVTYDQLDPGTQEVVVVPVDTDDLLNEAVTARKIERDAIVFDTINDMINKVDPVHKYSIDVLGYHAVGDGGGGRFYWDEDSTEDEDKGLIFKSELSSTGRWKRLYTTGPIDVRWFGAKGDGVTDDADAFRTAIKQAVNLRSEVFVSPGTYYIGSEINCYPDLNRSGLTIKGAHWALCKVVTDQDIVIFRHTESMKISHIWFQQIGTSGTGKALATPTNLQTSFSVIDNCRFTNFKFGILWRYSIWCTLSNLYFSGCTCGIRLARNDNMEDQTNPVAPGFWNLDPGWFHNQLSIFNVACVGGEVGIWGSMMGASLDNVTCQNQTTTGTSNKVLPAGMHGTGLWLDGGSPTNRSWNNTITNFYAEFTRIPIRVENTRNLLIDGFFLQGFASGNPGEVGLVVNNSSVRVRGANAQDYFKNMATLSNSSSLYGSLPNFSTVSKYTVDSTSSTHDNENNIEEFTKKYTFFKAAGSTGVTYEIPVDLVDFQGYTLRVNALIDGYLHKPSIWQISRWNSATLTNLVNILGSNPTEYSVTLTSTRIRITVNTNLASVFHVTLERNSDVASQTVTLSPI